MCKPRSPPRQGQPPVYAGTQTTLVPLRIKLIDNLPIHLESKKLTDIVKKVFFLKVCLWEDLKYKKWMLIFFVWCQSFHRPISTIPRVATKRLFFIPTKKCFHIFLFCQIISNQFPIINKKDNRSNQSKFDFLYRLRIFKTKKEAEAPISYFFTVFVLQTLP